MNPEDDDPPLPPPGIERRAQDRMARLVADRAAEIAEQAIAAVRALGSRVAQLEGDVSRIADTLGRAPDEATGRNGSGIAGTLVEVLREVRGTREEQGARDRRRRRALAVVGIPSVAAMLTMLATAVRFWVEVAGWH